MNNRILLIDDSASVRKVISDELIDNGFYVEVAVDGVDGIKKLNQQKFGIIMTDVNMPNMNGLDFIKIVKEHPNNRFAKVVVLTTESYEYLKETAYVSGVNVWITKPFIADKVINVLNRLAT